MNISRKFRHLQTGYFYFTNIFWGKNKSKQIYFNWKGTTRWMAIENLLSEKRENDLGRKIFIN